MSNPEGKPRALDRGARAIRAIVIVSIALVSVPVASVLVAAGVTILTRWEPVPHPLPAESDLPPLPPRSENGWTLIAVANRRLFDSRPPSYELLRRETPPRVTDAESIRSELESWEVDPGARAVMEYSLSRPRFAIACSLELQDECSVLTWLSVHHTAAALTVRDALHGSDVEALARTEQLLRADRDALATARALVPVMAALLCACEAIELAVLVARMIDARENLALDEARLARIDSLHAELLAWRQVEWSMESGLKGEWIRNQHTLDFAHTNGIPYTGLDHARARAALADYHVRAIAYARDPSRPAPRTAPPIDWVWRLSDPMGTFIVETLPGNLHRRIDQFHRDASRSRAHSNIAIQALEAARARANVAAP